MPPKKALLIEHVFNMDGAPLVDSAWLTVEARKLEYDHPLIPNKRKKENKHKSSYIRIPSVRSLLYQ